jgi:hypothetical protein
MFKQTQEDFLGATPLMEWLIRHSSLPMRKAKMVMEKAVKHSEKEGKGKISYQSLIKALAEMKVNISIKEQEVEEMQRPKKILTLMSSIGTPSEKRIKENIASLQKKVQIKKDWLIEKLKGIEKAKILLLKMEKQLGS